MLVIPLVLRTIIVHYEDVCAILFLADCCVPYSTGERESEHLLHFQKVVIDQRECYTRSTRGCEISQLCTNGRYGSVISTLLIHEIHWREKQHQHYPNNVQYSHYYNYTSRITVAIHIKNVGLNETEVT